MKLRLMVVLTAMAGICPAHDAAFTRAINYGAKTKVVFHVIDDCGNPVSDAFVKAGFYLNGQKGNAVNKYTGKHGFLTAERKSVGEINYWINKDRYYETSGRVSFERNGVKDGRWQPYGATNTVVLKRKVNPVAMYIKPRLHKVSPPLQDTYIGYDLQVADFVSPYGKGISSDFCLKYNFEKGDNLLFYRATVSLVFTNKFDGIYKAFQDKSSTFTTDYNADTNASYASKMTFAYDRLNKVIVRDTRLQANEYLVLRVRSSINSDGNLVSANYAKITEFMEADMGGVWFTSYFNPNPNSTSLEADTSTNLLNTSYKSFILP